MPTTHSFDPEEADQLLSSLTELQYEAMERAAAQMTSKEIGRELNLHPNTVDQRISAAIKKLGASDRNEACRRFIELCHICGRTICGSSVVDVFSFDLKRELQELPHDPHFRLEDSQMGIPGEWGPGGSQFLEVFDRRFGRVGRVALIVGFAIAIAILALSVISIGTTLNDLV